MNYLNYLKNFDFDVLYNISFLLPFFGIIIIIKILSVILFSIGSFDEKYEYEKKVTVFSNIVFYLIFSFSLVTIYDHYSRKEFQNFRFSSLGGLNEFDPVDQGLRSVKDDLQTKEDYMSYTQDSSESDDGTSDFPTDDQLLRLEKDPVYAGIFIQLCKEGEKIKNLSEVMSFEICGHEDGFCEWCGDLFQQKKLLKPSFIAVGEEIGIFSEEEGWNTPTVYRYVMDYKKGIKFQCIVEKKKFCSVKCDKEFKKDRGY